MGSEIRSVIPRRDLSESARLRAYFCLRAPDCTLWDIENAQTRRFIHYNFGRVHQVLA
jgi:hypothetical protein